MDPAARRDTPHSGMPAGRGLPAVTKNRNYPQPVKHLKPMALTRTPAPVGLGMPALSRIPHPELNPLKQAQTS